VLGSIVEVQELAGPALEVTAPSLCTTRRPGGVGDPCYPAGVPGLTSSSDRPGRPSRSISSTQMQPHGATGYRPRVIMPEGRSVRGWPSACARPPVHVSSRPGLSSTTPTRRNGWPATAVLTPSLVNADCHGRLPAESVAQRADGMCAPAASSA